MTIFGYTLSILDIVLIVLVLVGVWAVVELALTLRRARSSIVEVVDSANSTIEQCQPIISKLDGMMDELEPAIKKIDPLLASANESVEGIPTLVTQCTTILDDVSSVSGAASGITNGVSKAATNAVSSVTGVFSKLGTHHKEKKAARLAEKNAGVAAEDEMDTVEEFEPADEDKPAAPASSGGYVVYSAKTEDAAADAAEDAADEVSA